jgi:hypothetical protein
MRPSVISLALCINVVVFIGISFWACSRQAQQSGDLIESGIIEYTISYPQIPEDSYLLDILPQKMETIFYEGSFRSDIVAGMGLIKTSIISKKGKDELIHSVKMLKKKYASVLSPEELKSFTPSFQQITVTPTDVTKEIAGYPCKGVDVKVTGDSIWSFTAYYTDQIKIENANQYTPFKAIKGVLMQYELISYDMHMVFTANKVSHVDVSEEDISLEEDYTLVEPSKLKNEIEAIFATIK